MKQYSDTFEKIEQKKNQQKIRSVRGEVLHEVLHEVLGEVLHEVFQAFLFYNSLIFSGLWKTTGGLNEKKKILQICIVVRYNFS